MCGDRTKSKEAFLNLIEELASFNGITATITEGDKRVTIVLKNKYGHKWALFIAQDRFENANFLIEWLNSIRSKIIYEFLDLTPEKAKELN